MKFLSVITLFLFCALSLWGDAVIVIKGKARRSSIKLTERSGITCRVRRYNDTTEVSIRARKKFQSAKLTFKVVGDDEYSFTLGGGYTRKEGDRKNEFEWIDCTLFKVNGQEMIGPKAGKEGKKSETLSRPKPVKGVVKAKKGSTLTLEVTVRSTPRKEAKKRDVESTMTKRQKERFKREEAKDKARAQEREREEKERKAISNSNRSVLEKRYGVKVKDKKQVPQTETEQPTAAAGEEPDNQ
ncbi:MAG: hypothetical protein E7048_04540 [Lentisphaerae bacterium]|nr:hypothetical protein [Lentisphaerota bacterium]